jgi:hypothetical protein
MATAAAREILPHKVSQPPDRDKGKHPGHRQRYNAGFYAIRPVPTMEAERLNAIANHLTDLQSRAGELRRYL